MKKIICEKCKTKILQNEGFYNITGYFEPRSLDIVICEKCGKEITAIICCPDCSHEEHIYGGYTNPVKIRRLNMKKIQIMVDGLRDMTPEKNCGDCIRDMHEPLQEECWESGLHEDISGYKTLIVCNRIKVIQEDLHKTKEEEYRERYNWF